MEPPPATAYGLSLTAAAAARLGDKGTTTRRAACENDRDDRLAAGFLPRLFGLGKELNRRSLAADRGFSRAYSLRYVSADRLVSWLVRYCLGFRPLQSRTFGSAPAAPATSTASARGHRRDTADAEKQKSKLTGAINKRQKAAGRVRTKRAFGDVTKKPKTF